MKFIKRFSNKMLNDKSGQSQIRLLNYLFGFIIVLSFWSIGQVVNSPNGEAWGNILRIGQLPIWLTMACNNNNNNMCEDIKETIRSKSIDIANKAATLDQAIADSLDICSTTDVECRDELDALNQARQDLGTAIGFLFSITQNPFALPSHFYGGVIAVAARARSVVDATEAYQTCLGECLLISDVISTLENDINSAEGIIASLNVTYSQFCE